MKNNIIEILPSDVRISKEQIAEKIKNGTKTELIFNDEVLYHIGSGHNFLYGFFSEYLTESGIQAQEFYDGFWLIDHDEYILQKDNTFFKTVKEPHKPTNIDFSEIMFPYVKNIAAKTIGDELKAELPKP